MGNSCGRSGPGRQRVSLMDRHSLPDDQMAKLEEMFKKAAKGKRHLSFKEFLSLYPAECKFQREDSDLHSVYYAFSDAKTNSLKFDGYVTLMLLSNRIGSLDEETRMQALFKVMDSAGAQTIPAADFHQFVRVFMPDDEGHSDDSTAAESKADQVDAAAPEGSTIGFEQFSKFFDNHKPAYEAICSYVFPI